MRKQLGVIVAACFYYSGLVKLARWHTQRSERGLVILIDSLILALTMTIVF